MSNREFLVKRGLGFMIGGVAWGAVMTLIEWGAAGWAPASYWASVAAVNLSAATILTLGWLGLARALRWRRRTLFVWIVLIAISFALIPWNLRTPSALVWVVADTLRADFLSLYGYPKQTTPFLEDWAKDIVVFDRAYSQASHTIVSAPSMLASIYPSTHGLQSYKDVLDPRVTLVSEIMQKRGLATFGAVSNPHLGADNGFRQGWDEYVFTHRWSEMTGEAINRAFFEWRRALPPGDPYFALLWYIDPHVPFQWDAKAAEWAGVDPAETFTYKPAQFGADAPPEMRDDTRSRYEAAVRTVDNSLAELVEFLRSNRDYEDTLILFTSDHGESMWEHGRFGHVYGLYDSLTHVPLVIRYPAPLRFPPFNASGGIRSQTIVSSVDLLPTTLDFLGVAADGAQQGRSFLRRLWEESGGSAYLEERMTQYGPYQIFGLREGRWKFIRIEEFEDAPVPRDLLFDLVEDPGEQHDLSETRPDLVRSFRDRVEAMRAEFSDTDYTQGHTTPDSIDLELLRHLGYIFEPEGETEATPLPKP